MAADPRYTVTSPKLDCGISKSTGIHSVLPPEGQGRRTDDARFIWDAISGIYEGHRRSFAEAV